MNICEFCKKELSSKSSLTYHQRTARFCLEIQGKILEDFKCKYCSKNFTTNQHLNDHFNSCKVKREDDKKLAEEKIHSEYDDRVKKIVNEYEEKIQKKDLEYKREVEILNNNISKLENKLESYEKRLFDMASRPISTNTNSNNKTVVINTSIPLTNEVLRQCVSTFTLENAKNIGGITRHFTESLEDHITCTDSSRNIFKYTNEKDEEIVDTDLENLLPQYLTALKDKNNFLYKEMFDYFKENNVSLSYQTDYNIFYNALNCIIEKKGDQNKYSEKMKKYIVRQCKKQFLDKNKNKTKEITKDLTDEEIMENIIERGGNVYDFIESCKGIDIDNIDNETEEQFAYRRKMEDLFIQKKREWKSKNKI